MIKTFPGGTHPQTSKRLTRDRSIISCLIPKIVSVPLLENTGRPAKCTVKAGDIVLKGQLIGEIDSFISARVHSPVSGKVIKIESSVNPVYGRSDCVVIENDFKEEAAFKAPQDKNFENLSGENIIEAIKNAGIVGLGGAAFPTHVKLLGAKEKNKYSLIINGAECEPYLTCDHRIMIEKPNEVIKGIELLARAVEAKDVYLAIENNKQDAVKAMEGKLQAAGCRLQIIRLKTKYPQGGEKQLIKAILNREVPPGKLPLDVGCIVQNVGTAYAAYEAIYHNKPLIERCVTLTGSCLNEAGNFNVRIGTSLREAVEGCSKGFKEEPEKLILGGPMMGIAHYSLDIPIIKGITGVIFLSKKEVEILEEMPCIRCGRCVDVCPVNLLPTQIKRAVKRNDKAQLEELNVCDCMECGACSYECASRIPLVQYIKLGKNIVMKRQA